MLRAALVLNFHPRNDESSNSCLAPHMGQNHPVECDGKVLLPAGLGFISLSISATCMTCQRGQFPISFLS